MKSTWRDWLAFFWVTLILSALCTGAILCVVGWVEHSDLTRTGLIVLLAAAGAYLVTGLALGDK